MEKSFKKSFKKLFKKLFNRTGVVLAALVILLGFITSHPQFPSNLFAQSGDNNPFKLQKPRLPPGKANPFLIENLEDFNELAALVNDARRYNINGNINAYRASHYLLINDITFSNETSDVPENTASFTPIGLDKTDKQFTGTFDGGNKTLFGLRYHGSKNDAVGLFGVVSGAVIRDLILHEVEITNTSSNDLKRMGTGALVGKAKEETKISNIRSSGKVRGDKSIGGIIGVMLDSSKINDSKASGFVRGNEFIGGLVGQISGSVAISDSHTDGNINGNNVAGGLIGAMWDRSTITNSSSAAFVGDLSNNSLGGLVGEMHDASSVSRSSASGDIKGKHHLGGLVGQMGENSMVTASAASGNIGGQENIGGLIGSMQMNATVTLSFASGITGASGSGRHVGGLVGHILDNASIGESAATGNVRGVEAIGGLVGRLFNNAAITAAFASGNVTGDSHVGGLVGEVLQKTKILATYSKGLVFGKDSVGGLIGSISEDATVLISYWDRETSKQKTSAAGTSRSSKSLKFPLQPVGIYRNWDLDAWDFGTLSQYPILKNIPVSAKVQRK